MNDNKPTWTSIGWTAALILNRLRNEKQIQAAKDDAEADREKSEPAPNSELLICRVVR